MNSRQAGTGGRPVICTPVVGSTSDAVFSELAYVIEKKPDMIEWRADYFDNISDADNVLDVANAFKQKAGAIPVIFTVRSFREGGRPVPLSESEITSLNAAICKDTDIEYVDFELSNARENIDFLLTTAHGNDKKVIASYHEHSYTPDREVLLRKFLDAETQGFDVAKVAVMPKQMEDVLTLLSVALEARKRIRIPLIPISLGSYGAVTRLIGGVFGASASFAVGHTASAPGQIPIDDLRTVLDIIEKTMTTCEP